MTESKKRLPSLDVFRGATMAAMVIVNTPGSWSHIHPPLRHAAWHGCTPTDLVFPFFLFIVGVSIAVALPRQVEALGRGRRFHLRMLRRVVVLIGLGLLLNGFPGYELASLRFPGVLQRIALCYGATVLLVLHGTLRVHAILLPLVLVAYSVGLCLTGLEPGTDFGSAVDRALFGEAHLYKGTYDPEGLLSTLPALANTLLGYWAGKVLVVGHRARARILGGSALTLALGAAWWWFEPLNKQLWTPSFALVTSGLAGLALLLCHQLVDRPASHAWATPFEAMGHNAILLFVGSGVIARLLARTTIETDAGTRSVWTAGYEGFFEPTFGQRNGSLVQAVCALCVYASILLLLHRRRIYWKV